MIHSITSYRQGRADLEVTEEGWDLTSPEGKEASDPGGPGDGLEPVEERDPRAPGCQEKRPKDEKGIRELETEMHDRECEWRIEQ